MSFVYVLLYIRRHRTQLIVTTRDTRMALCQIPKKRNRI